MFAIDADTRNWPWENKLTVYWRALSLYGLLPWPPPPSGFLWSFSPKARASSSPAIAGDFIYMDSGTRLFSVDIRSQEERWEFEAGGTLSSSPAVIDNTLYIGSEDSRLYALDVESGEKLWDFATGGMITSSPAVADGTVYVGSHDGNLYAIQ